MSDEPASSPSALAEAEDSPSSARVGDPPSSSRQWRALWRLHFYSGMFALPFILLMALTGLVILYTQPLEDAFQGDVRTVDAAQGEYLPYSQQEAAVEAAYPDATVYDMTVPSDREHSTRFWLDDGSTDGIHVFVDPYTGEVLGDVQLGGGIVGLSYRLHGYLNNDAITVPLPAVSALWDDGAVMRDYVVGDLMLEVLGVWTLVLVGSGLYLFWPRKSRQSEGSKGRRRLVALRRGATGRARWRDLHGLAGLVLVPVMIITIVSGMGWSTYWADNFNSLAETLTPGRPAEQTASTHATRGDLDRFGNQIPWSTGDYPIPASYAPATTDGSEPAPLGLDAMVRIAEAEGMKPGYTIAFPVNDVDEAGNPVYGSFTLYNSWPRRTSEARDVFIDQFSGQKLDEQKVYGLGAVYEGMDTLVSLHMGTELGLFSRVLMTALCVLSIWMVISAFAMFWRRRRPGTLGLPRRPADPRFTWKLVAAGVTLGVVFPQWGVVALVVLGVDKLVVQRIPRLRRAFGQS